MFNRVNLLAYVDINPVKQTSGLRHSGFNRVNPIRAGIVKRPEEYRWSSLGYFTRLNSASWQPSFAGFNRASVQSGNKDDLLSLDFGLRDWNEDDPSEIVRKYGEFVYETGAVDAAKGAVVDQKVINRERRRKYKVSRTERFLYRSRYFTDTGIIGSPVKSCLWQGAYGSFHRASKEFVGEAPVKWKTTMKWEEI